MKFVTCLLLSVGLAVVGATTVNADEPAKNIKFKKVVLDQKFRSEGAAIGDFNHDGKLDISAGDVYYAAPDWKLMPVVEKPREFDPHGYSESFNNFADDINGDGRTDLIVVSYPGKETFWFEQPSDAASLWPKHVLTPITNNESPDMVQVLGDGKRELILDFDPGKHVGFAQRTANASEPWKLTSISGENWPSSQRFAHGIGAGDLNGDGRSDILVIEGWWEQPATLGEGPWPFHPVKFGEPCSHMLVYDFDGDGDNDVLTASAHKVGIWWHEQTKDGWETHVIDESFSQTHSVCLADINGDGLKDFVTGKRWWAHGPKGDPGSDQPAVLYWFELVRKDGKPEWVRHEIDNDSGVGTQFEVGDVNGDGLLDIAIANKHGAFYFEQQRP
jgi:hypothetical protein